MGVRPVTVSPGEPRCCISNRFATVPDLASLFGCHAFRDLNAQCLPVGGEQLLAFRPDRHNAFTV